MIQDAQDPASLARLNDIALPPEISLWPSAPGWLLLGAALLVASGVLAVHALRRHRALRYRREALAELADLRAADEPAGVPRLLKRVALCTYPRAEVASLAGADWTRFLDRTGGAGRFEAGPGQALAALTYGGDSRAAPDELFEAAEAWIRAQGRAR